MYAALIAAGASILGNVLQRNAQEEAYNRQQKQIDAARARSDAHYLRQYYTDGTQRADTQRALTQARQNLLRANMAASGRNAVMGGTNASAAAAKQVSSEAYANVVASAAANAEARKDRLDTAYQAEQSDLTKQQMTLDASNDQANVAAIGNATNQIGGLASSAISANDAASIAGGTTGSAGGATTRGNVVSPMWNSVIPPVSQNASQSTGLASKIMDMSAINEVATRPITQELTQKVNQFYGGGRWSGLIK